MKNAHVVSRAEWLIARGALLEREKEFTRQRDELSAARRDLPWVRIDEDYRFAASAGETTLSNLFGDCSQLLVYHFMFGPDWQEGCPSCSFWADNYNGVVKHLEHRDISLVAISRAPLEKISSYRERMGWNFNWVSSLGNRFNQDFNVSFPKDEISPGDAVYNYRKGGFFGEEAPGISLFYKNPEQEIFHTYSCYARGLDMLNSAYHMMDLAPRGRHEEELPYPMAWVRRRDQYED